MHPSLCYTKGQNQETKIKRQRRKDDEVLLTGFDPFGGESVNPAFEAIKLLPDTIAGAEIVKVEIPTEFTRSISCVEAVGDTAEEDVSFKYGDLLL